MLAWIGQAAQAAPHISSFSGIVQTRTKGYSNWVVAKDVPLELGPGDSLRTGAKAKATVAFDDGSRIEMAENGFFTLDNATAQQSEMSLDLGKLRAFIKKLGARRFMVRTPTAVCSVRGTEFAVDVQQGGKTTVDLYKGLLGVEDRRGQQILMQPNERIEVDRGGMGSPQMLPTQSQLQKSQFHGVMRREMSLDMSKEEVMSTAAREIKLAEFQLGKALIDVFGERVRLEEYIVRPTANQFKLVVLNERPARFDYFYYLGTFNKDLPRDMSTALRQLPGSVDAPPEYYLTKFETGRSNTKDSIIELAADGHLVDVNHNATTSDDVYYFYNSKNESFEYVEGRNVYQTLYDKYGFYINGKLKYGWTGSNIESYSQVTGASNTDPITGAALSASLPSRSISLTFPEADKVHQVIYESYSDGTFTKWDNYIISNEGQIASFSDFNGTKAGPGFKERLLDFNFEQVITASEFGGRKIDLVVEPKILIQSGLIQ